jgi:hypothetical protein
MARLLNWPTTAVRLDSSPDLHWRVAVRSNGTDVKVSSLSALDVFMEPDRSARIRCGVCHTMQQVKRGLMVEHGDCAGSFTHYTFDRPYEQWQNELKAGMDALRPLYDNSNAIDPRVRRATAVSPVRYPAKPTSVVRLSRPTAPRRAQVRGHMADTLAHLDETAKKAAREQHAA